MLLKGALQTRIRWMHPFGLGNCCTLEILVDEKIKIQFTGRINHSKIAVRGCFHCNIYMQSYDEKAMLWYSHIRYFFYDICIANITSLVSWLLISYRSFTFISGYSQKDLQGGGIYTVSENYKRVDICTLHLVGHFDIHIHLNIQFKNRKILLPQYSGQWSF